jgi:acyl dehydratase
MEAHSGGRRFHLDDLRVGDHFVTGVHTVTAEQMVAFASQFDPQIAHLDEERAKSTVFGGLVASGWHTAALMMRLLVDAGTPISGSLVGLGGELAWLKPVRPGDVLQVHCEILQLAPSRSRPDRGVVTFRCETRNQREEVVQVFIAKIMAPRDAGQGHIVR